MELERYVAARREHFLKTLNERTVKYLDQLFRTRTALADNVYTPNHGHNTEVPKFHQNKNLRIHAKAKSEPLKIVLPKKIPLPKHKFYVHTQRLIRTEDDPVLRYLPVLPQGEEYERLSYYESTTLTHELVDANYELCGMLFMDVISYLKIKPDDVNELSDYVEKRLFIDNLHFVRSLPLDCNAPPRTQRAVANVAILVGYPLSRLLRYWQQRAPSPTTRNPNPLFDLFCPRCLLYDCSLHEAVRNINRYKQPNDLIRRKAPPRSEANYSPVEPYAALMDDSVSLSSIVGREITTKCASRLTYELTGPTHGRFIEIKDAPYVPCSHYPLPCSSARCSCYLKKTACEVYCACDSNCERKTTCDCKGACQKCPCFSAGRECSNCGCDSTLCINRSVQKHVLRHLYVSRSVVSGFGCFTGEFLKNGTYIGRYVGEIISDVEAERRGHFYDRNRNSYLFGMENNFVVDAMLTGNELRFVNHSDAPNCITKEIIVKGDCVIAFYAARDIEPDEELFFDYKYNEEYKRHFNLI